MQDSSLVSVIIPNKDKGAFLRSTVNSALSQSYKNLEVIIVDDGSRDNSPEILDKVCNAEARANWYPCPEGKVGGSAARNFGVRKSKGEFLLFLDSDDQLTPNCIEHRMIHTKDSDAEFFVFPTGTFIEEIGDSLSTWRTDPSSDHLMQFLRHRLPWNIMSVLWRRGSFEKLFGFDEHYSRLQDVELHTRALLSGMRYQVVKTDSPDAYYRISNDRHNIDQSEMCARYLASSIRYASRALEPVVAKSGVPTTGIKRALQRTLISSIHRVYLEGTRGNLSRNQVQTMVERHIRQCREEHLFTFWGGCYAQIFSMLCQAGGANLRGFQRIFLSNSIVCH